MQSSKKEQNKSPVKKITNDPSDKAKFPSDFVWGAATSSYQIEGAVTGDGKVHDPNRIDFLARYLGEV
ncbi:family 1 glycosylhydrolase [Blautia glucerasea]|uniref:family 1 glycosylhydrolase n=1 Tax=Blautia glucerasea TaxID=536633 RepID=UPI002FE6CBFA